MVVDLEDGLLRDLMLVDTHRIHCFFRKDDDKGTVTGYCVWVFCEQSRNWFVESSSRYRYENVLFASEKYKKMLNSVRDNYLAEKELLGD